MTLALSTVSNGALGMARYPVLEGGSTRYQLQWHTASDPLKYRRGERGATDRGWYGGLHRQLVGPSRGVAAAQAPRPAALELRGPTTASCFTLRRCVSAASGARGGATGDGSEELGRRDWGGARGGEGWRDRGWGRKSLRRRDLGGRAKELAGRRRSRRGSAASAAGAAIFFPGPRNVGGRRERYGIL